MEQVIGSIRALSRAILDETKAEAERIVSTASASAHETAEAAQEQALEAGSQVAVAADVEIAHLEQQSLALAQLDAQRLRLEHRERLIERVFSLASERLDSLRDSPEYGDLLRRLIIDGVDRLGQPEEVIVRVAERDGDRLAAGTLAEVEGTWQGRVQLVAGQPIGIGSGVVVETADGHRRCDNSLSTRLSREKQKLRTEISHLLLGVS
jgi:vacuolar-type H+-ATPase subunit E/Vma4